MMRWICLAATAVILTVVVTLALQVAPEPEPEPEPGPSVPAGRDGDNEGPPPKLELVGQAVYDFGMMPKHTKGTHSWEVKNVGPGPLRLWMEESTCSCTVAKLENSKGKEAGEKKTMVVPPGRSTPVEVTWDTKAWTDFAHSATLGTNDPEHPSFTLAIRGKVLAPVAVLPAESISFPPMSDEEGRREKLTIISPDRADLKLTQLATSRPGLIVAQAAPLTPEEAQPLAVQAGYTVTVEIKPGMPRGRFNEELVIQTDDPRQPEVRVPLAGKVSGPISVVPEQVRIPNVTGRKGARRVITLLVRGGRDTQFQVARKPAKVQVEIRREDTPTLKGRYLLTVTVPADTTPGPVNDRIILKTDHPKVSRLEIPVSIYISRAASG